MESVGAYELEDLLGEGATARVYRAKHKTLHNRCALKLFASHVGLGGSAYERFIREAKALERISHPNVVRLIDFGVTEEGAPYLVMEWVPGQALARFLKKAVSLSEAVRIAEQIADGLGAVHKAGLVHRDLKPHNVMMLEDGTAKIVDFGMVRGDPASFPAVTRADAILGTPHYMAPEQAAAEQVDERADLYSLGTILFRMLTGSVPFGGDNLIEVLSAQVREKPPRLEPLHGELGALVDALLEKDPADRPKSAAVVRDRLRTLSPTEAEPEAMDTLVAPRSLVQGNEATPISPKTMTPSDSPTPIVAAAAPPPRRRPPILLFGIVAVAVAVGGAAIALRRSPLPEAPLVADSPAPTRVAPRIESPPARAEFEVSPSPAPPVKDEPQKPRRRRRRNRVRARSEAPPPPPAALAPAPPKPPPDPELALAAVGRLVQAGRASAAQERRYFDLRDAVKRETQPAERLASALGKLKRQIEANPQ